MLRFLQLIAAVMVLTFGWLGGVSASEDFSAAVMSPNAVEFQMNQDGAVSLDTTVLQHAYLDHKAPEHCQGDSFHTHCVSCTATLSTLVITELQPFSIYRTSLRTRSVALFIDPIEYPPK